MATSSNPLPGRAVSGQTPPTGLALLVHGGAWDIPDGEAGAHAEGVGRAVAAGRRVLARGGSALDAAEAAVAALEAHPAFDAGRGAVLDRDGAAQLDAGIMCGPTLRWGAVANVRTLPHPIRVARALLEGDGQARLLVADGAERFAAERGLPAVSPAALVVAREAARYDALRAAEGFHTSQAFAGPRGTVGAVARDAAGRLAAATSTGGAPFAPAGRVGDAPLVGAGVYADAHAAASATGWGEAIAAVQLCARASARVSALGPEAAAREGVLELGERVRWPGAARAAAGLILLDASGAGGWAFSTPRMARGGWAEGGDAWSAVDP